MLNGRRFWVIAIAVTVAAVVSSCAIVFNYLANRTAERAYGTIDYVQQQSIAYEAYNASSKTKSSLRALENASQLARDIEQGGGDISVEKLQQYAGELRLTGVIVLSPEGEMLSEYSSDEVTAEALYDSIHNETVLDVADHAEKVHAARVTLSDDSYVDVSAATRTDQAGIVIGYYHTAREFAHRYELTAQSLLDGYDTSDSGTIVVENGGSVVASNDDSLIGTNLDDSATGDKGIVDQLKGHLRAKEASVIFTDAGPFLATMGKARDNYVYIYITLNQILTMTAGVGVVVLCVCLVVIVLFRLMYRRADHDRMAQLIERELEYSESLAEAAQRAEDANTAKTEFLQRMSHDIRTPINGILGMVQVAECCTDDPKRQQDCLRKIKSSSSLLLGLVNEVLDMSKLESGEILLDEQPMNIADVIEELQDVLVHQAAIRDITIASLPNEIDHQWVLASVSHVKRLLMNIMSNAVKYNKEGGTIELRCREIAFDGTCATYEFMCADTGIGMSEEFQQRLFEPFAQENQGGGSSMGGTGLGMPIAKALVEVMGGTLAFESKLSVGTKYVITIPFAVCDSPGRPDEFGVSAVGALSGAEGTVGAMGASGAASADEPSIEGMTILLVEDNHLNMEIAEFLLDEAGAHVIKALNGQEAVDAFAASAEGEIDVVLMDIMMPVMGGYEATRAIHALDRPDAAGLPIFAMTANAFADDRRLAHEAGMAGHIAKPFDAGRLKKTLVRYRRKVRE